MTTISNISTSSLSDAFRKRAVPPDQHINAAETFLSRLSAGAAPTETDRSHGQKIYDSLSKETELYAFHATVFAAQESASTSDLDSQIDKITASITRAEQIKERLTSALSLKGAMA